MKGIKILAVLSDLPETLRRQKFVILRNERSSSICPIV
jgi:hypothetical protein